MIRLPGLALVAILLPLSFICAQPYTFRVEFTDKHQSPFTVGKPEEFLSPRALERRARFDIPILENDLPVNQNYLDSIRSKGGVILTRSRWFNSATVAVEDSSVLDTLLQFPFIRSASLVKGAKRGKAIGDKFDVGHFIKLDSLKFSGFYGDAFGQIDMLRGQVLHRQGYKGEGMVIAVIDAGFRQVDSMEVFKKLFEDGQVLGTYDFVDREPDVYEDHNHGSVVLSTMAAYIPQTYVGTAYQASYWLLRSEDVASEFLIEEDNWLAAAEFADSVGADIINSSLGYTRFDDPAMDHSYTDMDGNTTIVTQAADMAAAKGMLVVNSAGNSGSSSWRYIGAPADGDSVLAVGAVNTNQKVAPFSSHGPSSDGRVKPNVCALGSGAKIVQTDGAITNGSGTSFSSPIIAGMAACLWQANPGRTNMEIIAAIEQSAHKYEDPDSLFGFGIPDFEEAHQLLGAKKEVINDREQLPVLYPNPSDGAMYIRVFPMNATVLDLAVFNMLEQKIYGETVAVASNVYQNIIIPGFKALPRGAYVVRIGYPGFQQSLKAVKY